MPELQNQLADNPEQREPSKEEQAQRVEMLDRLGMALSKTRSEAIDYRTSSGIENEWMEDREHYEGIDDTNRGELGSWESKPLGQGALQDDETGSTVFFNITRPYCDTASARVGDMLLPVDDKGWSIDPTPIPDMVAIANGDIPPQVLKQIEAQVQPEKVDGVINKVIEEEKLIVDEAKKKAEAASRRIEDWQTECQFNAEVRTVIDDTSITGTGVLKGPIPETRKRIAYIEGQLVIQDDIQPVSRRVQVANCFPDPSCGMHIQNGAFHWERDDISDRALNSLKEQEGYLEGQIEACIKEGPFRAVKNQDDGSVDRGDQLGLVKRDKSKLYEIWYYYGRLKREELEAAGIDLGEEVAEITDIDIHIVMVNNRVIRAARNHLDSGEFPYDYMVWQSRSGMPFGIGISRQIRVPQRIINGAGRNLMDNAGMAGGPMWVFNQGLVEPIDGIYEIAPRKGWYVSEDAEDPGDVRAAFTYIDMPMMQADLQAIINLGMEFAELISGLPSILQGQQQNRDETLGGQQMRRNDGSTILRRIARQYDDLVTTPHIRRYYDWLLMYGEDDEKGDFTINAKGSSALVERDIQSHSLGDLLSLSQNPVYGLDPKKTMAEYLKSQRFTPKNFEYDDQEWQQIVEQMSAPPPDSSVQVAEIRAELEQFKLQSTQEFESGKILNDNDQSERDRQLEAGLKSMEQQLKLVDTQAKSESDGERDINKIKAHLAETIMSLKTQVQLSEDGTGPEVATPVVEPEGRAPDGQSFQK